MRCREENKGGINVEQDHVILCRVINSRFICMCRQWQHSTGRSNAAPELSKLSRELNVDGE